MIRPLITIIIPAYNYASYIPEAIESLQSQTHKNWECIVVDDGSTDNTSDIIKQLQLIESRIKYIYQNNQGLSATRNTGLKNADGEYIQFLDADDLIESEKLERQLDFLMQNPQFHIIYGETRYFRNEFPDERRFSLSEPDLKWMPEISGDDNEELLLALIKENFIPVNAPLLKREVIDKIKEFDPYLGMFADWDFWLKCAVSGFRMKFLPMEKTLALVRIHSLSMTHYETGKFMAERLLIREKINKYKISKKALNLNNYYRATANFTTAVSEVKSGKLISGISKLIHSGWLSKRAVYEITQQIIKKQLQRD
jgi:glycosyltransferase involved in cell wall biosynthesis